MRDTVRQIGPRVGALERERSVTAVFGYTHRPLCVLYNIYIYIIYIIIILHCFYCPKWVISAMGLFQVKCHAFGPFSKSQKFLKKYEFDLSVLLELSLATECLQLLQGK